MGKRNTTRTATAAALSATLALGMVPSSALAEVREEAVQFAHDLKENGEGGTDASPSNGEASQEVPSQGAPSSGDAPSSSGDTVLDLGEEDTAEERPSNMDENASGKAPSSMEPEGMVKAWNKKVRIKKASTRAMIKASPYSRNRDFCGSE